MTTPKLYDLACRGENRCWNPFAWKTRLVLNYKGIEYTTEFLEYPQVAPTIKDLGVKPNETGLAYTIPTMRFPDGTVLMDSEKIVETIEQIWPDKPLLYLDTPIVAKIKAMEWDLMAPLFGVMIPRVPRELLSDESVPYFVKTRSGYFGELDQFEKEKGGSEAWFAAEQPWKEMAELLKLNGGPFFLGTTVSYADFYILGLLHFGKRLGGSILEKFLVMDPAIRALYEAAQSLFTKDD